MKIKIINKSTNELPKYQSEKASGMDIQAYVKNIIILKPLQRKLINTGLYIELPNNYEAQIRSRSGLALKKGIICLNSPGTIDSDYRGEILIILINLSSKNFFIYNGDRIAQIIFSKYRHVQWIESESLNKTLRDDRGIGSTGI